jgi:hypothetical protein
VRVRRKLDGEIASVHGATIPPRPEAQVSLSNAICCQSIRPQIVPMLTYLVSPLTQGTRFSPAQFMSCFLSCSLCYIGKKL